MDTLRPKLINISGRCYRVNDFDVNTKALQDNKDLEHYEEEMYDDDEFSDIPDDGSFKIEKTEEGRFKAKFHVARTYIGFIVGAKGNTRKAIESETRVSLKLPRLGQDGDVVIFGSDENGIKKAYRRINMIVGRARQKQQMTHFISIRCTSQEIISNFLTFKTLVMDNYKTPEITEKLFQTPEKLHLTLGCFVLSDLQERTKARQILDECRDALILPAVRGKKLTLHLKGLEIMNDDPSAVRILFVKVKSTPDGLLQNLADDINSYFENSGLLKRQFEKVKLHLTIMNSYFVSKEIESSESSENSWNSNKGKTFNATKILTDLGDFDFGSIEFQGLDLSIRHSTADDGFYQYTATVNLTSCVA